MRHSLIFIIVLLLSGCDTVTHPKPSGIITSMPGPPNYTKGWEDGCFTGMGTYANSYYSTFYHFRQDPHMTTNQMYYQAWKDAYAYCRIYVLNWTFQTVDNPDPTDPNK